LTEKTPQILLTNDDGIDSPGLWAAAEALSEVGYVWVAAPREQASGTGRSMLPGSDGIIAPRKVVVHEKEWTVYSVGGTPAQTVQHAIHEIIPQPPDLVVSGINFGSNFALGVTVSGTVGAALEGAANGIRSLAVSLETDSRYHINYSDDIDFSVAAYFTAYFARLYLSSALDPDVQLLKVEIPSDANRHTPWEICRLSKRSYYLHYAPERDSWDQPGTTRYTTQDDLSIFEKDSDVYVTMVKRAVAVTPLTLDMTSRAPLSQIEAQLRGSGS
jgi:5'-nucleotidase